MAPEKAPAFQFYPRDFLTDGRVAAMTLEERGAYITLLCLCWTERELPLEEGKLARMLGCSVTAFRRIWPALGACFTSTDTGWQHGRLEKERAKQDAYRARQSHAGKASAATKTQPRFNQKPTAIQPDSQPNSSLLSTVSDLQSSKLSRERTVSYDSGVNGERAGRLVERYGELFLQHRGGARYRPRPALDWQDALTLVPVWDDARLEKLAVLVLTTDDPWISQTDRGFKIFAMKASWADDRLRAWEAANGVAV